MWGPPPRVSDGCGVLCVRLWRPKGEYPKYQYERKALLTLFGPGKKSKKMPKKKRGDIGRDFTTIITHVFADEESAEGGRPDTGSYW